MPLVTDVEILSCRLERAGGLKFLHCLWSSTIHLPAFDVASVAHYSMLC
jgi:hypothetical protein